MKIRFEKEIIDFFSLPSIPTEKNLWDGKSSFKDGIAVVKMSTEALAYAVCAFDENKDAAPRVKKTFTLEPFNGIERIYVVPTYMNTNVESMDLDDSSKKAAERLAQEAEELTKSDSEEDEKIKEMQSLPEWVFEEIHNKEEAIAWLKSHYANKKRKGRVPTDDETIKMRLLTIYSEIKEKNKE